MLHLPSFLYVSCRLLPSSLTLTNSHSAFLSTTHTTLRSRSLARSRHPRGQTALHRPAPSRARAGLGLRGLSLSGSGRLGAPVPSRLMPTRNPSPVTSLLGSGRLGLPAALRPGLTRIPASSHVTHVDYSSSHRCGTSPSACGRLPQQVSLPMVNSPEPRTS